MKRTVLVLALSAVLTGCALHRRSWALPFHATNDQLQAYACQRYGSWSDSRLHNGFCSGYVGLLQIGSDDELTLSSDVRRGAKAEWRGFEAASFKNWLAK